jgi:hypothetical protein
MSTLVGRSGPTRNDFRTTHVGPDQTAAASLFSIPFLAPGRLSLPPRIPGEYAAASSSIRYTLM